MKHNITPITTQPLRKDEFHQTLGQHLIKREGRSLRIHTESEGIPTLGPGYALAVQTKKGLKLRPLEDMEQAVRRGTGNSDFRFDLEELDRLQKTVDAVNVGDITKAQRLIPSVDRNEEQDQSLEQANNHFSFTIDKNRRLDVIKPEMKKAQEGAWQSVEQKAKKQGWSPEQVEGFKKQFFDSEEMLGLASLKFNIGAGAGIPDTAKAIVTGDRARARAIYEIEVRSNKSKVDGIANRRMKEAEFLRSGMKEKDKSALEELRKSNSREFDEYREKFPQAFPDSTTDQRRFELPPKKPDAPELHERPEASATIIGGNGEDQLNGGSGDDDALSPEHRKVAEDLTKQDNPLEEILDKDPADLTEGELRQVMLARKSAKTDTEREKLFGVEKAFYDGVYGTGNAKYDVTGKIIEPTPIRPINEKPVPARGKGGKTMVENLNMLAKAVAVPRSGEAAPEVVKALQTGLNILNRARTNKMAKKQFGSAKPMFSELKGDGIAGPKTRGAFKTTAAKLGPAKVKEGMALGRFKRFAEAPMFGDLRAKSEGAFGSLFRRPSASKPKSTDEGLGLQATINDLGGDTFGNSFKLIKEDGDIGPKTETAFNQVLPTAGADSFTSKLGENFGFFDDDEDSFFT
jgi:GH24 family phage-related lysozyme (muramidase)